MVLKTSCLKCVAIWQRPCFTVLVVLALSFVYMCVKYVLVVSQREVMLLCPSSYTLRDAAVAYTTGSTAVVDCGAIFEGRQQDIEQANAARACLYARDENYLASVTKYCHEYKMIRTLNKKASELDVDDEEKYPLAFSILAYENPVQLDMLLSAIYRPQNIYCIHIDASAPDRIHRIVKAIAGCYDNVLIVDPVQILWGHISTLEAEMSCLRSMWNSTTRWRYWINLGGRDFPIKTDSEIVQILKILNGTNDIEGSVM